MLVFRGLDATAPGTVAAEDNAASGFLVLKLLCVRYEQTVYQVPEHLAWNLIAKMKHEIDIFYFSSLSS